MKTKCMTFPRSGHRLLADLLGQYLNHERPGTAQSYFYRSEQLIYCKRYGHCNRHPCIDPHTNFQKDHDFQLQTPLTPTMAHVVQIRHPLNSLPSWFLFHLENQPASDDSAAAWETFARAQINFWKRFVRKWLLQAVPNRVVIHYEQLVTAPSDALGSVLRRMGTEPIRSQVDRAVCAQVIEFKHSARSFRYYNHTFFAHLAQLAEPELGALGYQRDGYI